MISDKVPVHKLSHLEHRDNLLAIEYRQQLFVCADVALILGILELVFANVLPKLFGQFGPGEWVVSDHCGKRGVGLHGFAKGVFGSGGFLGGRHRAIRTRRAWLPSKKTNRAATYLKENKPSIGFCYEGRLGRRVVLTSQREASNFVAQLSSLGRCARESSQSDSAVQPSVASSEP